jgi:diphthamide biosynthesis protein 4
MAYTKNYYTTLGLAPLSPHSTTPAAIRAAYRTALLAAHPDKATAKAQAKGDTNKNAGAYTVDDVKEAHAVLSVPQARAEYDSWLALNPAVLRGTADVRGGVGGGGVGSGGKAADDFVLGLEVLDLSDFVEEEEEEEEEEGKEGGEGEMLWTRACRCGDERGFRIRESELVEAEERGDKEVLVGCSGCSLWVRVAFEVDEG